MNKSQIVTIAASVTLALASSLAEAIPQHTAEAVQLPATTGWSAILALIGVLALIGGIIVMTRRRLRGTERL
jgi:nitrate reductase gamma subunit